MRISLLAYVSALPLSVTLLGCGGDVPPPAAPQPPVASVAPPAPPPASAAASAPPEAPIPPPASPFSVYGSLGEAEGWIAPLGEKALISVGRAVMLLDGDQVVADPNLLKGMIDPDAKEGSMEDYRVPTGAFGEFPKNAYLGVLRPWGRVAGVDVMHWEKDHWVNVTSSESEGLVATADARGTVLGTFMQSVVGTRSVRALGRGARSPLEFPSDAGALDDGCFAAFNPSALAALPSGVTIGVGVRCSKGVGTLQALTWPAGKKKAALAELPGVKAGDVTTDVGSTRLFVMPDGTAELWTMLEPDADAAKADPSRKPRTYVARFDGAAWKELPAPAEPTLGHQLTKEGTMWMRTPEGKLLRKPKGGTATEVVLPEGLGVVSSFWAHDDSDVWARLDSAKGGTLIHTRPNPKPGTFPSVAGQTSKLKTVARPRPLGPDCTTPFVFLFAPTKLAPADFDYPLTRKAVKGHKEYDKAVFVEWKVGEKRYFGAKVPTADMAKKLTALITKELKGSAPQAVCHDPEPARTLKIDLATGEVVK